MEIREGEKTILKFLSHFMLLAFMVAVAIVLYIQTSSPEPVEYKESYHVPESDILTAEEVNRERYRIEQLNTDQSQYSYEATQESSIAKEDVSITQNQNPTDNQNPVENDEPQKEIVVKTIVGTDSQGQAVFSSNRITFDEQQAVNSNSIKEYYKSKEGEDEVLLNIQGSIHQLDSENKRLVVAQTNKAGFGIVRADEETNIQINGKKTAFANLKIGDVISAEGYGYQKENDLKAAVITITGSVNIF